MDEPEQIIDHIADRSFVRSESVACPLCNSTSDPRKIAARFGMTAMVAECHDCRIAYQTPRPSREACIAYMDWRWSSQHHYVTDNPAKRATAANQMALVSERYKRPGRLLDFGAGSGTFVRAALDAGWDAIGLEHSTAAAKRAEEYYGVALVQDIPAGKFDVITLWDVIEHLKDPIGIVGTLRNSLAPGGSLIVSTGNYESWMRVARKEKWGLYLLDHHYYFTPASLKETFKRAGLLEFELVPAARVRPSLALFRRPMSVINGWKEWRECRKMWPEHFDVHELAAIGRSGPSPGV